MSVYQFSSSYSVLSSNGKSKKEQTFEYKDNKKHIKGELKQNNDGKHKYESVFKSMNDFEKEINEQLWGKSENESNWKIKKSKSEKNRIDANEFEEDYTKYSNFFNNNLMIENNYFNNNFMELDKF